MCTWLSCTNTLLSAINRCASMVRCPSFESVLHRYSIKGISLSLSLSLSPDTCLEKFTVSWSTQNRRFEIAGLSSSNVGLVRGYTYLFDVQRSGHPFSITSNEKLGYVVIMTPEFAVMECCYSHCRSLGSCLINNDCYSGNLIFAVPTDPTFPTQLAAGNIRISIESGTTKHNAAVYFPHCDSRSFEESALC